MYTVPNSRIMKLRIFFLHADGLAITTFSLQPQFISLVQTEAIIIIPDTILMIQSYEIALSENFYPHPHSSMEISDYRT